jgi:vacuolar protein sorting-associated protein 35
VDVRGVMVALMDRLADFAKRSPDLIPEDLNIFQLFCSYVAKMTQGSSLDLAGILTLQVALLNFAIRFAPGQMDYIDQILGFATRTLQQNSVKRVEDTVSTKAITQLLTMPLETYSDVLSILDLSAYPDLMSFLPYSARKSVSLATVRNLHKFSCKLADNDKVEKLFGFIQPIVKDESDQPDDDEDKDEFEEEQNLVAPVVQLFENENSDVLFKMYCTARRHFGQGGTARIKHTLPPLIFCALQLARRIRMAEFEAQNEEKTLEITVPSKKLFAFVLETVTALGSNAPELALRLFLQCAQEANNCRYDTIAYEFVTQAFLLYEDEISDSKVQEGLISVFVGSLSQMKYLGEEEYDTLITKTTQYSAKLLKKPEQCRAIYRCAHLFWNNQNGYKDGKRVLECLQRSLKIADVCMQSANHANLFVEILNEYLYYFAQENEHVVAKYLQGLIDLIKEHIANMEEATEREAVLAHYKNTLQYIGKKKEENPERYGELNIDV